ncbi:BRO-B [Operophtera brumata nucleopolyhedrovirus]|uniref:BRO-B n=1 Tax=Operophtera brumata nucleopolyhedrovirus TaxID=1046267 RepID=A0A2H4V014_9ABAC|nr:BRO-B [Operophtera brumata nucleopolyhedrovirus]AUA60348.1 BRO-B [Operophtera brumata nucleopolyhedrovirus]
MEVTKVQFADQALEVKSLVDETGLKWFLAKPFAKILGYSNAPNAINKFVTQNNRKTFDEMRSPRREETFIMSSNKSSDDETKSSDDEMKAPRFEELDVMSSIHPQSKFINEAGLFELIQSSSMPKAKEFKQWVNSDLLPKLAKTGEYNMALNAPKPIVQQMDAIHQVTHDGEQSQWTMDLMKKCFELQQEAANAKQEATICKLELIKKDHEIANKTNAHNSELIIIDTKHKLHVEELMHNYERQLAQYEQQIQKSRETAKIATMAVNVTMTQFGVSALLANDNIAQNKELRSSLTSVSDRVIPEMSTRPEKEQYASCYRYYVNGKDRYRITRNQLGEIDIRDRAMRMYNENPSKIPKLLNKYPWAVKAEKFHQVKCPNAISLWVKIREYPEKMYGLRFTNNAKTEIEFLDEDELRQKYRADMMMTNKNLLSRQTEIANFQKLAFKNEDDAVVRCFVEPSVRQQNIIDQIQMTTDSIKSETIPTDDIKTYDNAHDVYTNKDIMKQICEYKYNNFSGFNVINQFNNALEQ